MRVVIEVIPYQSFKEKINIVKAFDGKARIEIFSEYVYVERLEKVG